MQFVAIQAHQHKDQCDKENLAQQHAQRLIARHGTGSVFVLQRIQLVVDILINQFPLRNNDLILLHHTVGQRNGSRRLIDLFLGKVGIVKHVLAQCAIHELRK